MNVEAVEAIAQAVLYEGYMLYPYRPSSAKNRHRWTFGGVYPASFGPVKAGDEAGSMQTELLIVGENNARLDVRVRFLHLLTREAGELLQPEPSLADGAEPQYRPVDRLTVGERTYVTWQEAVERDVACGELRLGGLAEEPRRMQFSFPAQRSLELVSDASGDVAGVLVRTQQSICGLIEVSATCVGDRTFKVTARITNDTPLSDADTISRDEALMSAFISTHTVLGVRDGEFVSLLDPPNDLKDIAAGCSNRGAWPVLVGNEGERDTMISSPIILYDYPTIAPESPGDLFDGTEIDEILTLRILAMTDDEKQEARGSDERARALLDRTENLGADDLMKLHGTVREISTGFRTLEGPER